MLHDVAAVAKRHGPRLGATDNLCRPFVVKDLCEIGGVHLILVHQGASGLRLSREDSSGKIRLFMGVGHHVARDFFLRDVVACPHEGELEEAKDGGRQKIGKRSPALEIHDKPFVCHPVKNGAKLCGGLPGSAGDLLDAGRADRHSGADLRFLRRVQPLQNLVESLRRRSAEDEPVQPFLEAAVDVFSVAEMPHEKKISNVSLNGMTRLRYSLEDGAAGVLCRNPS